MEPAHHKAIIPMTDKNTVDLLKIAKMKNVLVKVRAIYFW